MSTGGINASQSSAAQALAAQLQAAQPMLAAAAAPTAASPAASVPTGFVPSPGVEAGSVAPGGGDIAIPRTAAIAGMVATDALQQRAAVASAQQTIASNGSIANAPTASLGQTGSAARGPAAWSDAWATKLADAGLDAASIQQLHLTGGMGADEAQLQQALEQIKTDGDKLLATFEHAHPEAFRTLAAVKGLTKWSAGVGNDPTQPAQQPAGDSDRAALIKIASAVNSGQVDEATLETLVQSAGKSDLQSNFDMYIKPFAVWALIPGWGALRLLPTPFTGGRDILTGEKVFGDPLTTGMSVLMAAGGAMTLYNNVRGAMQVAQANQMIAAGGDAATVAAKEGLQNLSRWDKFMSYVPGTKLNQQLAGLSRLDDIRAGIGQLDGLERKLAQNVYDKIVTGDVQLWGESASQWKGIWGYQPNSRGFVVGNLIGKKGAGSVVTDGMLPKILLDGRTTGKVTAAHLASLGTEFADGPLKTEIEAFMKTLGAADGPIAASRDVLKATTKLTKGLRGSGVSKSALEAALPDIVRSWQATGKVDISRFAELGVNLADDAPKGALDTLKSFLGLSPKNAVQKFASQMSAAHPQFLKTSILGSAGQQMLNAADGVVRPSGLSKMWGALRPGPVQDVIAAADNLTAGTIGKLHGWAGISKLGKFGIIGGVLAGAGALYVKSSLDAAQAAQGQQGQTAAGSGQLSAEDQALLQRFAAMPAAQQQQIIAQAQARLQQAQDPQAQAAAQQELQLLQQAAVGSGAASAAPSAPATPAAPTTATATVPTASGYTAAGLGLA